MGMVAARHADDGLVQARADHELPYEHSINNGHRMFGNKIEPPEAHALTFQNVRNVTLDPPCVVRGTSGPQKIERHRTNKNDKSLPPRKGAQGMHHPDT